MPMLPDATRTSSLGLALLAALVSTACAPRAPVVIGPVGDPEGTATELRGETGLQEPLRIVFGWQLNDGGQRVERVSISSSTTVRPW
jgi:hypothetical protein